MLVIITYFNEMLALLKPLSRLITELATDSFSRPVCLFSATIVQDHPRAGQTKSPLKESR
jgi:hypothetical protein